jgi:hypothetical protein
VVIVAIWGVVGVLAGALLVVAAVWRVVLLWLRRAGWRVQRPLVRAARAHTTQAGTGQTARADADTGGVAAAAEAGRLVGMARTAAVEGEWARAAGWYEQASALYTAAGDALGWEVTRFEAARAYCDAERADTAAEMLGDVVVSRRRRHDRAGEREAMAAWATALIDAGRLVEGGAIAVGLAELAAEAKADADWVAALRLQAEAAVLAENWARARRVLETRLEHAQHAEIGQCVVGRVGQVVVLYKQLSRVCAKAGDTEAAERYEREAEDLQLSGDLSRDAEF